MTSFHRLTRASVIATFALVTVGGLVRATKSGLGCGTDWPDCSGRIIPVFGHPAVAIEYAHRLAAGAVVLLLGAMALLAIIRHRHNAAILWGSLAAFVLVLFQAGLGAVVVILELQADTVVLHLATAMSLLALLVYLDARAGGTGAGRPSDPVVARASAVAGVSVLVLLLVGSYLGGNPGAAKAFSDWPLMGGQLIPDLAIPDQALHFFHRALAAAVGIVVGVTAWRILRSKNVAPGVARLARAVAALYAFEILLGAANVLTSLNAAFVTLHLATGAAIWASLVRLWAVTSPVSVRVPASPEPVGAA